MLFTFFVAVMVNATTNESTILVCEKKDFFYWQRSFHAELIQFGNQFIVRYTYSHGTASVGVTKVSEEVYQGSSKFLSVELRRLSGNLYEFMAMDTYDGLLGIGPIQVVCSKN